MVLLRPKTGKKSRSSIILRTVRPASALTDDVCACSATSLPLEPSADSVLVLGQRSLEGEKSFDELVLT